MPRRLIHPNLITTKPIYPLPSLTFWGKTVHYDFYIMLVIWRCGCTFKNKAINLVFSLRRMPQELTSLWKVQIGRGNDLVLSGNKTIPEPMLILIYVAICHSEIYTCIYTNWNDTCTSTMSVRWKYLMSFHSTVLNHIIPDFDELLRTTLH